MIVFLHSILNVKLKNIPSFQREIIIFRGCSLYSFHRGALDFPLGRFAPIPKSVRPTDRSTAAAASEPTTTKSRVDTLFFVKLLHQIMSTNHGFSVSAIIMYFFQRQSAVNRLRSCICTLKLHLEEQSSRIRTCAKSQHQS